MNLIKALTTIVARFEKVTNTILDLTSVSIEFSDDIITVTGSDEFKFTMAATASDIANGRKFWRMVDKAIKEMPVEEPVTASDKLEALINAIVAFSPKEADKADMAFLQGMFNMAYVSRYNSIPESYALDIVTDEDEFTSLVLNHKLTGSSTTIYETIHGSGDLIEELKEDNCALFDELMSDEVFPHIDAVRKALDELIKEDQARLGS